MNPRMSALALMSFSLCLSHCGAPVPKPLVAKPAALTLAFGGDVFLGRQLHHALYDDPTTVFADIREPMVNADITLVNGEGVIASGGMWADKGSNRPFMFRAHPLAIDMLTSAGVDVVAVGNNHAGDYGPLAMGEMLGRLRQAGIDYTGGGTNITDARTPAMVTANGVVVAFVGADMTHPFQYAATESAPGTLYFPGMTGDHHDEIVASLTEVLAQARKYADVVILTPHWGPNRQETPTDATRKLAHDLIGVGYDGILGHSAHWLQGVELIDGKPVVYDAGNLVTDTRITGAGSESLLYEVGIAKEGIVHLHARPLTLGPQRVSFAQDQKGRDILDRFEGYCKDLGTRVQRGGGGITIVADPGTGIRPTETEAPPPRPTPEVVPAPDHTVREALPDSVTGVNITYEGGAALVGHEVLFGPLRLPKTSQIFRTCWTGSDLEPGYTIHVEGRGQGKKGKPASEKSSHLPGDWLHPTETWTSGQIICDHQLFRINTLGPEGEVRFYVGLKKDGEPVPIVDAHGTELVDEWLVEVGKGSFAQGAPGPFSLLATDLSGPLLGTALNPPNAPDTEAPSEPPR